MNKIILMLGIILLFVGGTVVVASLTTSNIKVEKVDDTYNVYVLKEQKTINEIENELRKLNDERKIYQEDSFLSDCIDNCPIFCGGMEEYKDCIISCPDQCEAQMDLHLQRINYEINKLKEIQKIK